MKIELRNLDRWLFGTALLLALLYFGRPLLVPLAFAFLLWAILNALVAFLRRFRFPAWLAWAMAFLLIAASLYFVILVLTNEASVLADQVPTYASKLQHIWSSRRWLQRIFPAPDFQSLLDKTDTMAVLSQAVGSIGAVLAKLVLVAVYVGFLLVEQRYLPAKLARFRGTDAGAEGEMVVHLIGRRIQSYLGVCTFLSIVMGVVSYALFASFGLEFAGFWALTMFFLTYIPVLGVVGAALPAVMALLQFGALGPALVILAVLSMAHFILTDVIETIMLGHSLNLSSFVIIVALTFWGLIWGVAGLFLAVPLTSAFVIACRHLDGMEPVADLLAGPPWKRHLWSAKWLRP